MQSGNDRRPRFPLAWRRCRRWSTCPCRSSRRCASAGQRTPDRPRRRAEESGRGRRRRRRRGRAAAGDRRRLEPAYRRSWVRRHRAAGSLNGIAYRDAGRARAPRRGAPASPGTRSSASASTRGLAGVECLSGIPGSTGATPIQNVGAYGQEVADTIVSVRAYDRAAGSVVELAQPSAGLRIGRARSSASDRHVVLDRVVRRSSAARSRCRSATRELARALGAVPGAAPAAAVARGGPGAAAAQGDGDRSGRPRLGQRRLVLLNPILHSADSRRSRGRVGRGWARRPGSRLARAPTGGQDVGRVADRARRLSPRLRRRACRDLQQAHARDRQPRAARAAPSWSRWRARCETACATRSGWRWIRADAGRDRALGSRP